jgi:RNA polymerase sigma-70 factor (ECF subfamily)
VVAMFRRQTTERLTGDTVDPSALCAAIDREAFAALYRQYFEPIYRYCFVRLGSQERAEDATHQIFMRALEAFNRYQETGRAREWLFVIAHNVVANEAVRHSAVWLEMVEETPDPAASPELLALASVERRTLREAISRLPLDQRQAIELRIAGLTGREVAAELGRSIDAIKMLQQRAIDRLRAELDERGQRRA